MRKLLLVLLLICGCSHARIEEHRAEMPIEQVPEKVLKVAEKKFPGVKFDAAWKLDSGAFEVRGKTKTGKIRQMQVSAAGEILDVE